MSYHRLFLAIKIPTQLQDQLIHYQDQYLKWPIFRLVPSQNLHATVAFLGNVKEDKINLISQLFTEIKKITASQKTIIHIQGIDYGPTSHNPRLVWAEGKASSFLVQLRWQIISQLLREDVPVSDISREWLPHITIARIKKYSSLKLPPETQIRKELNFDFSVSNIWLIESILSSQGAEYKDLEKFTIYEEQ